MYEVIGQSRSTGASATGLKERRRPSQPEAEGPCKDVGLAIAMADKLGAGVIIRRKTYIYVQEAFRQGRTEDDFTRLYPDLEKLDPIGKKRAQKAA